MNNSVINDKKKTEEEVEELRKKEREATHDLKRAELVYKARLENVQVSTLFSMKIFFIMTTH